jgi:hypothetical protein
MSLLSIILLSILASSNTDLQAIRISRTEDLDDKNDWIVRGLNLDVFFKNLTKARELVKPLDQGGHFIDLVGTTYSSDGRFLNATLSFNAKLPSKPTIYNTTFGVLVNTDQNENTGFGGNEYVMTVSPKNDSKSQSALIEFLPNGDERLVESHLSKNSGNRSFVNIDLDINQIGNPEKFTATFFLSNSFYMEGHKFSLIDQSDWMTIPYWDLFESVSPSFLELHPGEDKPVDIQINSSSGLEGIYQVGIDNPGSLKDKRFAEDAFDPIRFNPKVCADHISNFQESHTLPSNISKTFPHKSYPETNGYFPISKRTEYVDDHPYGEIINGIQIDKPFQEISFFDAAENTFRINIKAAENATAGIRDVFVETDTYNLDFIVPIYTATNFYTPDSIFGGPTLLSCLIGFNANDFPYVSRAIKVKILPPLTSEERFLDFWGKFGNIISIFLAFLLGLISKPIYESLNSLFRWILYKFRARKQHAS